MVAVAEAEAEDVVDGDTGTAGDMLYTIGNEGATLHSVMAVDK